MRFLVAGHWNPDIVALDAENISTRFEEGANTDIN
jgi:hypothetical protein